MEVLGKRVKWLRERKKMAQKEVSIEIGMSLNGYQKIEYGERDPKLNVLIKLAKLFDTSTDFLLGLNDSDNDFFDLYIDIKMSEQEIEDKNETDQDLISEIQQQRMKMLEYGQAYGMTDKRTLEASSYLDELLTKRNEIDEKHLDKQRKYGRQVLNYISEIVNMPYSKPYQSILIEELQPFKIGIQESLFEDSFSLSVSCNNGFLGYYGNYTTEEEAKAEQIFLLDKLNGDERDVKKEVN